MDTSRLPFSAGVGSLFSSDSSRPAEFLPYPLGQEDFGGLVPVGRLALPGLLSRAVSLEVDLNLVLLLH